MNFLGDWCGWGDLDSHPDIHRIKERLWRLRQALELPQAPQ